MNNEQLGPNRSSNTVTAAELIDFVGTDSEIDVSETQWNCDLGDFEQPAKCLKKEPTSNEENTYSLQDHHRNIKGDMNC